MNTFGYPSASMDFGPGRGTPLDRPRPMGRPFESHYSGEALGSKLNDSSPVQLSSSQLLSMKTVSFLVDAADVATCLICSGMFSVDHYHYLLATRTTEKIQMLPKLIQQPVKTCHNCKVTQKELGKLYQLCGGCNKVYYCSRECQIANWKRHQEACKAEEPTRPNESQLETPVFESKPPPPPPASSFEPRKPAPIPSDTPQPFMPRGPEPKPFGGRSDSRPFANGIPESRPFGTPVHEARPFASGGPAESRPFGGSSNIPYTNGDFNARPAQRPFAASAASVTPLNQPPPVSQPFPAAPEVPAPAKDCVNKLKQLTIEQQYQLLPLYVQPLNAKNQVDFFASHKEMVKEICKHLAADVGRAPPVSESTIVEKKHYCVLYQGSWYRGLVERCTDKIQVSYIDFGNMSFISKRDCKDYVRELPAQWEVDKVPPAAMKMSIRTVANAEHYDMIVERINEYIEKSTLINLRIISFNSLFNYYVVQVIEE